MGMSTPSCRGVQIVKQNGLYLVRGHGAYTVPPVRNLRDALYYFALYALPLCVLPSDLQEYTDAVVQAMALWGNEEPKTEVVVNKARLPHAPFKARVRYWLHNRWHETERLVSVFDDGSAECILQSRQCRLRAIGNGIFEEVRKAA